MAPQVSALSQTLQSLTLSKIRELEKQRSSYEDRKAQILREAEVQPSLHLRVSHILVGTKSIHPTASEDATVANIERWLQQHCYDSSVTDEMLCQFEGELLSRLDAHSRRLSLADLYSRLLTEWTDAPEGAEGDMAPEEEDFMVVDERQKQRLMQLVDQFEQTVFTPRVTNEVSIGLFLSRLFPDEEKVAALEGLRKDIGTSSDKMFKEENPFNQESLEATIKGLLTEDILSEEKQGVLRDFVKNKVALTEIADVLNMRWADLENWDWYAGEHGIPVLPRQQLNGKYRIWMDEDVLQLIFVQYIGTRLCNLLKETLKEFIEKPSVWNWNAGTPMTEADKERRTYYLGAAGRTGLSEQERKDDYRDRYFLSQLPLSLTTLADGGAPYDDDDSDDDDDEEEDVNGGGDSPSPEAQKNIKQQLLRKIATETLIQKHIFGEAAVIQSDLKWYATGLPHSTIFAIMSFLGFPDNWLNFFHKYLASPLNLDQAAEGRVPVGPRVRQRGVPMAHSSEKFIGEMILFLMDLAVNRTTGLLLYRLHDDLWLSGEPAKCAQAWEVMGEFAQVTGLEFNMSKTGSVYLAENLDPMIEARLPKGPVTFGFLALDPSGEWVIDLQQVNAHIQQLKKQLDGCDGVMAWIRTWNSCIGRFFKNTFGQPAMCFGQAHVDSILTTYKMMQEALFGGTGTTVTQHLRQMIVSRFGVSDIPDALFYYPEELGGLGLRNPFISPFLVRDSMQGSPHRNLTKYEEDEMETYNYHKKRFQELTTNLRASRWKNAENAGCIPAIEKDTFFSFEEYTKFRWSLSYNFQTLYMKLQGTPDPKNIKSTTAVSEALAKALSSVQGRTLDPEKQWILELYAPEVLKKYGGVSLVDKKYLPVGVMTMVKEKRVKWQMVL